MKVLFNADDYGLTKGVTDGIITAHTKGVISSTTLMMNGLAVDYAIDQARKHPELKVGIHLVLTWGKSLRSGLKQITDAQGTFRYKNTYREMEVPDLLEVEAEWRAQLEAFQNTGLSLHHIDSHHHVHGWEPLRELVLSLAKEYEVPVRYAPSLKQHSSYLLTEMLWLEFYEDGITSNLFDQLKNENATSIEVMTHPAFVDDALRHESSYTLKREEELEVLCSLHVPEWVELL